MTCWTIFDHQNAASMPRASIRALRFAGQPQPIGEVRAIFRRRGEPGLEQFVVVDDVRLTQPTALADRPPRNRPFSNNSDATERPIAGAEQNSRIPCRNRRRRADVGWFIRAARVGKADFGSQSANENPAPQAASLNPSVTIGCGQLRIRRMIRE